jgi:hypothetical protein
MGAERTQRPARTNGAPRPNELDDRLPNELDPQAPDEPNCRRERMQRPAPNEANGGLGKIPPLGPGDIGPPATDFPKRSQWGPG